MGTCKTSEQAQESLTFDLIGWYCTEITAVTNTLSLVCRGETARDNWGHRSRFHVQAFSPEQIDLAVYLEEARERAHHARQLRDAFHEEVSIVHRTVLVILDNGWFLVQTKSKEWHLVMTEVYLPVSRVPWS